MALKTRTRSTRVLVVTLVSVSLLTITVDYKQGNSGPLAGLGRAVVAVMAPLQEGVTRVTRPLGNFFSAIAHLPSLRSQNEQLQRELDAARTQIGQTSSEQQRLKELESIFRIRQTFDAPTTAAVVIGSGVSNSEWSITIDKGTSAGVQSNMPVVTGAGLVGHVVTAAPNASTVQLIIDPDSAAAATLVPNPKTPASDLGSSNAKGELDGQGPNDLRLRFVRPDEKVKTGQLVQTSGYRAGGLSGLYPPGIPIGSVVDASNGGGALEQSITVRPAVDFSALDLVLVVRTANTS